MTAFKTLFLKWDFGGRRHRHGPEPEQSGRGQHGSSSKLPYLYIGLGLLPSALWCNTWSTWPKMGKYFVAIREDEAELPPRWA